MNIASIDIGSNTVLLLIASIQNNSLIPIINMYESPRLGKGLNHGGIIDCDRIDNLLIILAEYKRLAEQYECTKIIVTATNAMRIASNSIDIINKIKNELNLNVEVISGEREAELSFLGASSSLPHINEKLVIDIGGGSTEIIYGKTSEIFFKRSFPIGVVNLTEQFLGSFPHSIESLDDTKKHLKNIFSILHSAIPKKIEVIAVAGTPTTLSCIKQNLKIYDENKVEGSVLVRKDLNKIFEEMVNLSPAEIKSNFGSVVNGIEDVLLAGLLILQHISKVVDTDIINISSRGIRYGNIINYIK